MQKERTSRQDPDPAPPPSTGTPGDAAAPAAPAPAGKEIGGPPGPEPTRFGDWEKGGRCIDF